MSGTITITLRLRDGLAQLEVADQGPGITAAERERVFDSFYSGKAPVDGKVKIFVKDQGTETVTLKNGKAKIKLGKFNKAGKRTIKVKFLGSEFVVVAKAKGSLTVI